LAELELDTGEISDRSGESEHLMKLQRFVEGLPIGELPDALDALRLAQQQNPTELGRNLEMRLVQRWAENDTRSAAAWALQSSGAIRQEAIDKVAGAWAERSLAEAAGWAQQLTDATDRQTAMTQVASAAVYNDPEQALELAIALPADERSGDLIARATGVWAAKAPADAVAWAKEIPNPVLREQAFASASISWADSDPAAAAEFAATSLSFGKTQDRAVMGIVQRWAARDAEAAADWVKRFPDGELREETKNLLEDTLRRLVQPDVEH
jgi:hypothetical protein